MRRMTLTDDDVAALEAARDYCRRWCERHQWQLGAAEIALGLGILAYGVQSGVLAAGVDYIKGDTADWRLPGAGIGAAVGALGTAAFKLVGGKLLGSIGVAAIGTAAGLPVLPLALGAGALLAALGYAGGDLAQRFLAPAATPLDFVSAGGLLGVGLALVIDGARRVLADPRVLATASRLRNRTLELVRLTAPFRAAVRAELADCAKQWLAQPEKVALVPAATTIGGALLGTHLAAGSVTVLGSSTLGSAALSLGLVAAPVWPVALLAAAGLLVGGAVVGVFAGLAEDG